MLESPDMTRGTVSQPHIVLASNSPRRKELLALTGWVFKFLTPQVDETPLPGEDAVKYVRRLAQNKVAAADKTGAMGVIIAADTSVVDRSPDGEARILGKPADHAEAKQMLHTLRGHTHQVFTAISILERQGNTCIADLCSTDVPMRDYTDEEIDVYVASGDPMDKAGAYGIQNIAFHPVQGLMGCFANVMGLPLCHLTRSIARLGIHPLRDVPQACQAAFGYNCPVFQTILMDKNQDYTCG